MGAAARQECPEGQGRALDEKERRELLRLQEPPRRGQGAQADPKMGCNGRGRARLSEAGRRTRSLQHRQRGRARTFESVVFADFWRADSGRNRIMIYGPKN